MALSKKILKVCKIDNLAFGKFAILNGVDYLGIHVIKKNQMEGSERLAKKLSLFGGKIIIVTKIKDIDLLKDIIKIYNPYGIQLHYKPSIDLIKKLKKFNISIKIFSAITDNINIDLLKEAAIISDMIIYDSSYVGGTGKKNSNALFKKFTKNIKNKILIAGGVDLNLIKKYKNVNNIAGFDVQSHFRNGNYKYFNRLENISRLIKKQKANVLSISITDTENIKQCLKMYDRDSIYNFHLDYSDGSLYKNFVTNKKQTLKKIALMKNIPVAIHIFSNSEFKINNLIKEFLKINPFSISSFFIQYYPGLNLNIITKNIDICVSIYYKDFNDYFTKWKNFSKNISIILPSDNKIRTKSFIRYLNKRRQYFFDKEVWIDRNLDKEKIYFLKKNFNTPFNVIVGKAITKKHNTPQEINEQLCI